MGTRNSAKFDMDSFNKLQKKREKARANGETIPVVDSGYRTPTSSKKQNPVPLPIASPADQLQAGWDAEVEAMQSPKVRYAGNSLSEVDAARDFANVESERANRAAAAAVNTYTKTTKKDTDKIGIAKQRAELALKKKNDLDSYFNERLKSDYEKEQDAKRTQLETSARSDPDYFNMIRRGEKSKNGSAVSSGTGTVLDMVLDRLSEATLTDKEKNVVLYYIGKNDKESAKSYIKSLDLDSRRQKIQSEVTKKWSEKHPFLASSVNIPMVYGEPLSYFANAGQMLENRFTGKYEPTNINSKWFQPSHISSDTGEGIGNAAYNSAKNAFGSETAGNVARDLSGVGLSIGRNAITLPLGQTGSLAVMSTSAAGSSTFDALQRGATPEQAFAAGTMSGLIESVTEKIPIDRIFKVAGTSPSGVKEIIKNVLKQSGIEASIEASEEAISNVAGNIADRIIMGDKSNYEILISNLMKNGISRADAEKEAFKQLYVLDTLKSSAGGLISGGIMGAGASAVGAARGRYAQNTANRAVDNAYSEMSKNGMFGDNTQSAIDDAREKRLTARGYYADPDASQNRIDTVRENINREYDSLTDPLNKRMEEIEAERSDMNAKLLPGGVLNANNDALAREYSRIKTMRDDLEKQREQRLSELDNLRTAGYTDDKEGIANWSDENRAKWREFNEKTDSASDTRTGEITDTANQAGADSGEYGSGRAVSHLDVSDKGNAGESAGSYTRGAGGVGQEAPNSYQEISGSRSIKTKDGITYQFNALGREAASEKSLRIADAWTSNGMHAIICDGKIKAIGKDGKTYYSDADAMVLNDGTVIVRNNPELSEAEIIAHEPIHYYRKLKPEIYKPISDVLESGGIDILNPYGMDVIDKLDKAYSKNHGSYIDLNNLPRIYEELIAQISGHHANDPEFARRMFSPLVNDYDGLIAAIENAHKTFAEQNKNNQAPEQSGAFSMPENVENGSKIMDESVGAMVHDPNSYSALQGKYGTIEPGENPYRVVDVPKQTSDDTKTRRFVRTAMESETTPDDFIPGIENMIKNGQFSYTPKSNEKSIRAALKKMKSIGFDAAVNEFRSKVDGNERIRAEDIALGELILAESGKLKNFELAKQTYLDLSILFTESGQVVQIASALKKMGPSGKYYFASKLVDRINKRIEKEGRVDASMERKNESIDLARNATKKAVKSVSKDMENISAEMWASKVGELLSNAIDKKKMVKEKTTIEHILSDLKKISRFYPKKQLKQAAKRRNVDTLRDYYANKEFYQKAWETAQDKIREKYKGNEDELAVFDRFIHSTLEYSGGDAQVSIIALAINDIINEKYQNRKNFRNRFALGLTDFTKIADELVEGLGVSGVDEQQIRNGVQRYFFTVKNLPNPNRLAKMISGASSKFGAQISKMLTQSATTKKELLVKVQKYLLETNNISHAEASIATDVIEKEFYRLLKSRSEKVLRNILLEKDAPNITKKDALSVLEKYLNLGAFNDTELSDAAMKKITGYNGIIVPDDLLQKYANAETDEESDAALVEIEKSIGEQIPADIFDKIDGWRYLSMLLNPLTHIRNLAGNTVSMPIRSVQNVVQTVMEKMIPKDSGMRTSAIKTNKEMRNLAETYLDSILDATSSKYNDTNWRFNQYRKIFKTKWLEALRKFNFNLMKKEDMFAKKHAFKTAFARMAKANGWDIEFLESGTDDANSALQRLVSHATEKALESTFQEVNQIAENISRIKAVNRAIFNNGNFSAKAGQVSKYVAMNAMLPFVKTTLNITNQSARYSGAALIPNIIGTVSDVRAAGKNARTVEEATHLKQEALVNGLGKISGGLSGVGLMLIGALMAALNVLRVEGDNEKKNAFEHMQGEQNYSIKLGDQSITITWAQPIATPLLVGAELYKAFDRNEENFNAYKVIETFTHVFDPITEMSFAKGALDTFNSIKHSKDNQISALLQSWATGYVNQFIPTIFGNIARTIDDTRRTTYSGFETNIEKNLKQNIVRKTVSKIPFASKTLEPYLDAWGREDFTQNPAWRVTKNFFEPWYRDTIYKTSVDAEIERLVSATSNDNLYPNSAPSSVSINDKTYYLMPEELTKYQKTMGQTAFNTLEKIFKNEKYKILSDEKKANIVSSIYDYSRALAQKEFVDGRSEITKEPDSMISKVSGAVEAGIDVPTFFITRENLSDEDLGEQTAKKLDAQLRPEQSEYFKKKEDKDPDKIQYNSARKRRILMNSNFTPQQKAYLDKTLIDELERPIDYTDENSFYFSQMSDAKQERWSDVTSRWSNMSKVDYYNIIDGISELGSHPKKAEVIAKLQTLGFGESGAYRFYAVAIAPKKK